MKTQTKQKIQAQVADLQSEVIQIYLQHLDGDTQERTIEQLEKLAKRLGAAENECPLCGLFASHPHYF